MRMQFAKRVELLVLGVVAWASIVGCAVSAATRRAELVIKVQAVTARYEDGVVVAHLADEDHRALHARLDDLAVDSGEVQGFVTGNLGFDAADGGVGVVARPEHVDAEPVAILEMCGEVEVAAALEAFFQRLGNDGVHEVVGLLLGERLGGECFEQAADAVDGGHADLDMKVAGVVLFHSCEEAVNRERAGFHREAPLFVLSGSKAAEAGEKNPTWPRMGLGQYNPPAESERVFFR